MKTLDKCLGPSKLQKFAKRFWESGKENIHHKNKVVFFLTNLIQNKRRLSKAVRNCIHKTHQKKLDVHQWASHASMFIGMFPDVPRKMFMYIKKMLMYRRKDCTVTFQLSTGLCTSNEFVDIKMQT